MSMSMSLSITPAPPLPATSTLAHRGRLATRAGSTGWLEAMQQLSGAHPAAPLLLLDLGDPAILAWTPLSFAAGVERGHGP